MSLIECKNLAYGYDNINIVQDLSFRIDDGDFLGIVGENGAGKTTLLKVLLHTLKPSHGSVEYNNFRQCDIGYLPQMSELQKEFPATVWEIVLSGRDQHLGLRPFYNKKDKEIAKEKIDLLQIGHLIKKQFKELSGGQKQRVLLARALCGAENILILDEPVTGLDAESTKCMYETIQDLNRSGITIIMISHDWDYVVNHASHVLFLGKECFFGTAKQFAERRAL